jgi:hypothetical protein
MQNMRSNFQPQGFVPLQAFQGMSGPGPIHPMAMGGFPLNAMGMGMNMNMNMGLQMRMPLGMGMGPMFNPGGYSMVRSWSLTFRCVSVWPV